MYRLVDFDGVTLPKANVESEVGTVGTRAALTSYRGGVLDADGTGRAVGEYPYPLPYRVELVGSSLATLRTELDALRAKRGVRGVLRREGVDAVGTYQWATARLLQVPELRTARNVYFHPITLQFLVLTPWYAATPVEQDYSGSELLTTVPDTVTLPNVGQLPITQVTITVVAVDAPLTQIVIAADDASTNFSYDNTLAVGDTLVIDTGAWRVTKNDIDVPDYLHIGGGHRRPDLLQIAPGGSTFNVSLVGTSGTSTIRFDYYEQYE